MTTQSKSTQSKGAKTKFCIFSKSLQNPKLAHLHFVIDCEYLKYIMFHNISSYFINIIVDIFNSLVTKTYLPLYLPLFHCSMVSDGNRFCQSLRHIFISLILFTNTSAIINKIEEISSPEGSKSSNNKS